MVFSNTTDKNGIIQQCEGFFELGDAGISGDATFLKQVTAMINRAYHKTVSIILDSQDEWDWDDTNHTDYPIATTALVASQQDYTFPASLKILKIKRVEVALDGSNWKKAEPFDVNERSNPSTSSSISQDFSTSEPFYDVVGNAIFLYPIPAVSGSGLLKIWFQREMDEFTSADTTQEPGIEEPFHPMLAIGAAMEYWTWKNNPNRSVMFQNQWNEYEARLRNFVGQKQKDRNYILKPAYTSYD